MCDKKTELLNYINENSPDETIKDMYLKVLSRVEEISKTKKLVLLKHSDITGETKKWFDYFESLGIEIKFED